MNINWQEIKEKYPNSYDNWIEYLQNTMVGLADDKKYIRQEFERNNIKYCYCNIEDFFWDYGIKLFNIIRTKDMIFANKNKYKEFKGYAIYQAFEIMEDK